jgi:hypothetical protein
MGLSDSPGGPACPSRASGWLTRPPPGVSRVASVLRVQACRRHYPGGTVAGIRLLPGSDGGGLPQMSAGSAPATKSFRGLLGVHTCYGLPARGVTVRPFPSEASAVSLPLRPLRLLLAGATVARWELHPLKNVAFARRTDIQDNGVRMEGKNKQTRTAKWPRKSIDRPSLDTAAGLAGAPGFRAASARAASRYRLPRAATLGVVPVPVAERAAVVVTILLPASAVPSLRGVGPVPAVITSL